MIHIVIAVHPVAADQKKIGQAVGEGADLGEPVVAAEIGGVSLGLADHHPVEEIVGLDKAQGLQLGGPQALQLLIAHPPQLVAFAAEILQPHPYRIGILDQPGAPVVENLQTAQAQIALLDIDPVVGRAALLSRCPLFRPRICGPRRISAHLFQQQPYGDKVPIDQTGGGLPHRRRHPVQGRDQLPYRHGGEAELGR